MTPIQQTIMDGGEEYGNCFQACVASLFDLPLEEVPHFVAMREEWLLDFNEWLKAKYGLIPVLIDLRTGEHWYPEEGIVHIESGRSARGDKLHSCLMADGKLVHDPYPGGKGLRSSKTAIFFVAANGTA